MFTVQHLYLENDDDDDDDQTMSSNRATRGGTDCPSRGRCSPGEVEEEEDRGAGGPEMGGEASRELGKLSGEESSIFIVCVCVSVCV